MTTVATERYYVPDGSKWPLIAALGLFMTVLGVSFAVNDIGIGKIFIGVGLASIIVLFFGWFSDVIKESLSGQYSGQVDKSFRQGMVWFISSEVFFFAAFFGCLFYIRNIALPWLGGEGHLAESNMLWEGFKNAWPLTALPEAGSKYVEAKEAMGAGGIPLINTIILLSSGVTVTIAHWGLKNGNKKQLVGFLAATVFLGVLFFILQAYEYYHAYSALGLTLNSGVYGSLFYMLTGFHGLHVTIGAIMLAVITVRAAKDHFTHENHFAFEAVAWYWHFVDVVWLGLYLFVYWM